MKTKLILVAVALVLIFGCDSEEYEAPFGDFSALAWITTEGTETSDYITAVNEYVGFRDVSQNAIEHTWRYPAGTRILRNDFNQNDTIYTNFISGSGPAATGNNLLNLLFVEPGVKEIVLRNVFNDSVRESVPVEGKWVVEKTFTVNVLDEVSPSFQVLKGSDVVLEVSESDMPLLTDSASWPTVTVEAGEQLTYVDRTTVGAPDNRTWTFNGGSIATSNRESENVQYRNLGTFQAGSILSRRADITKPAGEATKLIPLTIEVVPSSQPLTIDGAITENESEVLSFKVSGQLKTIVNEENNFTVNVTNTVSGFNETIPVASVTINPDDASQIDLVLSAPIFNSDDITVSYTSGAIQSEDSRILASFDAIPVVMNFRGEMNIEGFTGYEVAWSGSGNQFRKANTEGYFAQQNGRSNAGPLYYFRDTSMAFEGNSSMKFETPAEGIPDSARLQGGGFPMLSPVTTGDYIPSVWVFIDNANTMNNLQFTFNAEGIKFIFDISTTPRGQWVRLTLPEVSLPDISKGRFDLEITNIGQDDPIVQKLWLDNFDLLIIEPRL
ncbi:hypothetical protein NBT05_06970 [Aquimarina sp. ERC-38]|uniref:SwmB domain-containing protein n=1 Tax=Aquimarina sp. ERC-38 TaxID=2949996 RepID=UPI002247B789|nr:SwmB domain-containing protein [Aquimarina sp. ERC-38]UZO82209.1 hypothetical protein NBT05_06970 [Aquimarina sp. ERC-38]